MHKTCYCVVHVLKYIQTFAAVITRIYEPVVTDIVIKKVAPHDINIITSVGAEKDSICCTVTHTKLVMFLGIFFQCFWVYVTNKCFGGMKILCNGYMDIQTNMKRPVGKEYLLCKDICYGISDGNIVCISSKKDWNCDGISNLISNFMP